MTDAEKLVFDAKKCAEKNCVGCNHYYCGASYPDCRTQLLRDLARYVAVNEKQRKEREVCTEKVGNSYKG